MARRCEIHGHRGARGLRPENTLPAFEFALDLGITVLELDLHMTRDGVPVICHDPKLSPKLARRRADRAVPAPETLPRLAALTLDEVRGYVVDRNPEPRRFPDQRAEAEPLAEAFCRQRDLQPYGIPTLGGLFDFVAEYAAKGADHRKSAEQRRRSAQVGFNIELKRVPEQPENIPDDFDGTGPARFETAVMDLIRSHDLVDRCIIQCFDWRVLPVFHRLEPKLALAALLDRRPAPGLIDRLAQTKATIYSPNHVHLTEALVAEVRGSGRRVIPYTINEVARMELLLDWEVNGLITDFPDRLLRLVQARHLDY
ncbi:MAG TPA: glycerophosphodiester phosphodiesterase family protein [Gemmatales bacterium]|nr:glycerophosphodiester phosphodiesterase family protein [Gemmatales bacterium]HMP59655.1 glycerophosphodiester phosphodiesterase family protein [Gemmatales bacterium]